MADDSKGRIDPRFDPAFQRGFQGAPPSAPRSEAPPVVDRPVVREVPIFQPPAVREVRPTEQPQRAELEREEAHYGTARYQLRDEEDSEEEPTGRRANPFLIALIAVAVALVLFGLYLFQSIRQTFLDSQTSSEYDFITLQTAMYAAPITVGLGVATGIGVLFTYAIRWRKRA